MPILFIVLVVITTWCETSAEYVRIIIWLYNLWAEDVVKEPSILDSSIHRSLRAFGHDSLKPVLSEAVQAILCGQDTFVSVPTGYGKSLIYQILPFCAINILDCLGKPPVSVPRVLIVSPLVALMRDQTHKLRQVQGANPILLSDEADCDESYCGWTHILASPEALLESPRWEGLLLRPELVKSLVAVVIDEAHCIVKWYVVTSLAVEFEREYINFMYSWLEGLHSHTQSKCA